MHAVESTDTGDRSWAGQSRSATFYTMANPLRPKRRRRIVPQTSIIRRSMLAGKRQVHRLRQADEPGQQKLSVSRFSILMQWITRWPGWIKIPTLATIFVGFYFTGQTLIVTQQQSKATQDQVRLAEKGQITDRFARAIEQLASEKLSVRLGAIFALERLVSDDSSLSGNVRDILAAFARTQSPAIDSKCASSTQVPAVDVQAAVTAMIRSRALHEHADLSYTCLAGMSFTRSQISDLRFTRSDLSGSIFEGGVINASFAGSTLDNVRFTEAALDFPTFSPASADGITFEESQHLRITFFSHNPIQGPQFSNVSMRDVSLSSIRIENGRFSNVSFDGANLSRTEFNGGHIYDSSFSEAFVGSATFQDVDVSYNSFQGAYPCEKEAYSDRRCKQPIPMQFGGSSELRGNKFDTIGEHVRVASTVTLVDNSGLP